MKPFIGLYENDFNNLYSIKKFNSPVLLIHGVNDTIIPYSHCQSLFDSCPSPCLIHVSKSMSHTISDFEADLISPISVFLECIKNQTPPLDPKYESKNWKFLIE